MRVIVVGPLPPASGGIAQHTAGVVQGLVDAGAEVSALTWKAQYPALLYRGAPTTQGASYKFGASPDLHWARPWTWSRAGRRARDAGLLVLPWVTPVQAAPIAALIRAARPAPTAVVVHNALPHERRSSDIPLTKWALKHAAGAVVHSGAVARDLATIIPGLPTVKVRHPPNLLVPPTAMSSSEHVRFLIAGTVRPYKGVDVAIEAMTFLHRAGIRAELTIAGEFWEPIERYSEMVNSLHLKRSVTLLPGYVPDESLSRLIHDHHVLLFPYRSSSQSGLIPIALGARRPVIASDVGGLAEEIDDGNSGLLVEPENPEALAEAMKQMSQDLSGFEERLGSWNHASWIDVGRALLNVSQLNSVCSQDNNESPW